VTTFVVIIIIIVFVLFCIRIGINLGDFIAKPLITKTCPFCKSAIPKDAVACKYCRKDIAPIKNEEGKSSEDILAEHDLWIEAVNKVVTKFKIQYPEVKFNFDAEGSGDVIIEVPSSHPIPKPSTKDIQLKTIQELRDYGIDAEARFLSENRIKTKGFFDKNFTFVPAKKKNDKSSTQ